MGSHRGVFATTSDRKLARKPSVSPVLSFEQDVSLRPAQGKDWLEAEQVGAGLS